MSADKRIRVMVVDDHPVVRDGLRNALVYSDEFDVVGQAVNGTEAVGLAEDLRPDVIVMDVIMPEKDGVDACREIVDLLPDTPVLMLTASTEDGAVIESIAAGATGYLLKDTGLVELLETVREVAAGCLHIPVQYLRRAFRTMRAGSQPASQRSVDALTSRERETLALFATGRSNAQISELEGASPTTVRNAVYRIQDKLGARTKQEVVVWAVRNGLLDDVPP